ncbi:hypothetical protein [Helicobacter marmotae]|uniref:hypothetical protein n=1 Tax=Helicobacter marmotae TaxID=152490 RepID=UPI0014742793|nr:hypothetical protein [Helicobacter marmotae]
MESLVIPLKILRLHLVLLRYDKLFNHTGTLPCRLLREGVMATEELLLSTKDSLNESL